MNNSSRPFAWIPLTDNNFAAPLTIDLGNDDLYLQPLSAYATAHWLTTSSPVLDYANALVPRKRLQSPRSKMAGHSMSPGSPVSHRWHLPG